MAEVCGLARLPAAVAAPRPPPAAGWARSSPTRSTPAAGDPARRRRQCVDRRRRRHGPGARRPRARRRRRASWSTAVLALRRGRDARPLGAAPASRRRGDHRGLRRRQPAHGPARRQPRSTARRRAPTRTSSASSTAALTRWADVVAATTGRDHARRPGAGAAGGLGLRRGGAAGGRAASGRRGGPGADRSRRALAGVDLVITGEGSLDDQTLQRQGAGRRGAAAARRAGVPVVAVAGRCLLDASTLADAGIRRVHPLSTRRAVRRGAFEQPGPLLERIGARIAEKSWPAMSLVDPQPSGPDLRRRARGDRRTDALLGRRAGTGGSSRCPTTHADLAADRDRRPRSTTRCCCPGWSTATCTSTSRAAPSGRASRRRRGRRRPAA